MLGRDAFEGERVAVLRALAVCVAREVPVRVRDETAGASRTMRVAIDVDRDAFWGALGALRDCGATGPADTAHLFQRRRGPGEVAEVARDGAAEWAWTIQALAGAGHEVRIDQPPAGRPSSVAPDDHMLTFCVHVRAEPFYALRPHQF